jgi:DNA-binding beta-propeller fold protein YncE
MKRMCWAIALLLVTITGKAQEYYFDSNTEKAISTLLQNKLKEIDGNGGKVYVMETQTGKIIAKVKSGNTTDNEEWLGYYYAPTYIALLETGKVKPTDKVDAGNGVYKDTYDHN